jgi:hypothetical protein
MKSEDLLWDNSATAQKDGDWDSNSLGATFYILSRNRVQLVSGLRAGYCFLRMMP